MSVSIQFRDISFPTFKYSLSAFDHIIVHNYFLLIIHNLQVEYMWRRPYTKQALKYAKETIW